MLDLWEVVDSLHIESYLERLETYVYGMIDPTLKQIQKAFRKAKKLKLPEMTDSNLKTVLEDETFSTVFFVT